MIWLFLCLEGREKIERQALQVRAEHFLEGEGEIRLPLAIQMFPLKSDRLQESSAHVGRRRLGVQSRRKQKRYHVKQRQLPEELFPALAFVWGIVRLLGWIQLV